MRRMKGEGRTAAGGFTLTELIVAMMVSMMVCGSLAVLSGIASRTFRVQPEAADLLQRARVGRELLLDELTTAGAGLPAGRDPQPLVRWIPAVLPTTPDRLIAAAPDRLTVITVPEGAAHAAIDGSMSVATGSDVVPLARDASCGTATAAAAPRAPGAPAVPAAAADDTCGFAVGQRVVLFDATPAFDIATVEAVTAGTASTPPTTSPTTPTPPVLQLKLRPGGASKVYRAADDAHVAVARVTTFSFDAGRRQLRRATGDGVDQPAVDDVVALSFRYFADPYPPEGPRPPPGEANCLFESSGDARLPRLTPDRSDDPLTLIELPLAAFGDGPWCGVSSNRFDADLYRIRRIRVRLRVQTASASLRGRDPLLFQIPGHAASLAMQIPDMVLEFDAAPRNLQVR
jgi:Tfp pilus assembly protein PilW